MGPRSNSCAPRLWRYRNRMRRSTATSTAAFLALLLLLGGSAAFAMKVKSKRDENVDFSKFKTYAWKTPGTKGSGTPAADEFVDGKIRKTTDAELAKRGLRKVG